MIKPTLVLDFDGVLHEYVSPWQGADTISDGPVRDAVAACVEYLESFDVVIVSSRCSQPGGASAIRSWLALHGFPDGIRVSEDGAKPPAHVTIDDRAITFTGEWPSPERLLAFKPWNRFNA